ncbi:MAG: hypothetical protein GX620_18710 [Chloroflexi bacterium]|nr:hypothetical protein [Chloroflexota bacterium]
MSDNRLENLMLPPRPVPLELRYAVAMGMTGDIGAVFLVIGLPFTWLAVTGDSLPLGLILLVCVFPVIGLVLFAVSGLQGRRHVRLLRDGAAAFADYISKEPTGTRINEQPVFRVDYDFVAADGLRYHGFARKLGGEYVGDDDAEVVLYLPSNPDESILLDALSVSHPLDVDAEGQWVSYESAKHIIWYAVAWLGMLGHMLAILWALVQGLG